MKWSSSLGLWVMDVMNGKIVEFMRVVWKMGDYGVLGLKFF